MTSTNLGRVFGLSAYEVWEQMPGNAGKTESDFAEYIKGGRGIVSTVRTAGTGLEGSTDTYTITYDDDTTSTFTVYNGQEWGGSTDTKHSFTVYAAITQALMRSYESRITILETKVTGLLGG